MGKGKSGIAGKRKMENGADGEKKPKSALDKKATARQITTERDNTGGKSGRGKEKNVLQATESPTGDIIFKNAKPRKVSGNVATFAVKSGAENGVVFGIKWENVKEVSGATSTITSTLVGHGFVKDGDKWVRRR
jgi:hypothetical protein